MNGLDDMYVSSFKVKGTVLAELQKIRVLSLPLKKKLAQENVALDFFVRY